MKNNYLINELPPLSEEQDTRLEVSTAKTPITRRIVNLYRELRKQETGKTSFRRYGQSVIIYPDLLSLKHAGFVDLSYDFADNSLTWKLLEVPSYLGRLHRSYKGSGELWKVETENGGDPYQFTAAQKRQLFKAFSHEPLLLQVYLALNAARGPKRQEINFKALASELDISRHRVKLFLCDLIAMGFVNLMPITTSMEVLPPPLGCPEEEEVSDSVIQVWLSGPTVGAELLQETIGKNGRRAPVGTETLLAFAEEVERINGREVQMNGRQWKFPASRLAKNQQIWDLARLWRVFSESDDEYSGDRYGHTMYTFERQYAIIMETTHKSADLGFYNFLIRNNLVEKWVPTLVSAENKLEVYRKLNEIYKSKFLNEFRNRFYNGDFDHFDDIEEINEEIAGLTGKPEELKRQYWLALAEDLGVAPANYLPKSLARELKRMEKKTTVSEQVKKKLTTV